MKPWLPPRVVLPATHLSPADAEVIRVSKSVFRTRPEALLTTVEASWLRRHGAHFSGVSLPFSALEQWEQLRGDCYRATKAGLDVSLHTTLDPRSCAADLAAHVMMTGPSAWIVECSQDLSAAQFRHFLEAHARPLSELPNVSIRWKSSGNP
jgi:hypothetical protein